MPTYIARWSTEYSAEIEAPDEAAAQVIAYARCREGRADQVEEVGPDVELSSEYEYVSEEECVASGRHLRESVDPDGYCNLCGFQAEGDPE